MENDIYSKSNIFKKAIKLVFKILYQILIVLCFILILIIVLQNNSLRDVFINNTFY